MVISSVFIGYVIYDQYCYINSKEIEDKIEVIDEKHAKGAIKKIHGRVNSQQENAIYIKNLKAYKIGTYEVYSKDDLGKEGDYLQLIIQQKYLVQTGTIIVYWEVIEFRNFIGITVWIISPIILLTISIIMVYKSKKYNRIKQ